MLTFDAHLDLSLNALGGFNRDLRLPVHEIRRREEGMTGKGRAGGTTAFPEMRKGRVGICVATQLAGCMPGVSPIANWMSPHQAWAETQGQLAWYKTMEEEGHMTQITNLQQLEASVALWNDTSIPDETKPIGYILSLEGADSIRTVGHLEGCWNQGLRAMGPAHYGVCRYAMGHDMPGGLPPQGRELIKEMDRLGMILDVTHLSDESFWEALDIFGGPVWASHSNCRALVPDVRQFSDEQLKALIARGAVIGAALDAWMMIPGWVRGKTTPQETGLKLEVICDHIDHISQLAGNAKHSGIGTDLDGGYGIEQTPEDLDTIADLARIPDMLAKRGYTQADIEGVMHGNYLNLLRKAWA
ncbi:dipeptidase [Brevifollis gellanilyticus]|uniref:Peptidase n=1 Tax=Brevifollis gellanilyticus TaxID=748831 RepID=A0A512MDG9_9BACT|nr:membrane dipeptidase [Brevifollis gellanilyticus]GEP44421.1 peptidase [Brevifollis gellanilyticus]